tara:strand:- start:405 stop:527 length:123 start_codon:yes stop_codon:yes gene_type:complete
MKSFLKILVLAGTAGVLIGRLIGGHAIKLGSIAKLVKSIK